MLQELTFAFVVFLTPDGNIVSTDMHALSVGRASVEQCVSELDIITAEFPDRIPIRRECIVREVDIPDELPEGHPPIESNRVPGDDEA